MSQHSAFILKPLSSVIEEAIASVSALSLKMEAYPLIKYLREALLLRMTGFQEQKLKCIMWELSTDDYQFRYQYLSGSHKLGEGSRYEDKKTVYKCLKKQIEDFSPNYSIDVAVRSRILSDVKIKMDDLFMTTIIKQSMEREYADFNTIYAGLTARSFGDGDSFIDGNVGQLSAKRFYEDVLIRERNRIAHNTPSYQANLPSFNSLKNPNDVLRNYFLFYAYLMNIDSIYVELFKKYQERPILY